MALSNKALQKKRAKKTAKRKEVRRATPKGLSVAADWIKAASAPIADALVPQDLAEAGIGTVWLSRQLPDGRYAIAAFLLDIWCLGVKSVMLGIDTAEDYRDRVASLSEVSDETFIAIEPERLRRLIEKAVDYAKGLGFEPHPEYRYATMLFGDLDPDRYPDDYEFGRDGRPFYVAGPDDTPAFQRKVMQRIEKAVAQDPLGLLSGRLDT